jgi:hypothetical protein
MSIKSKINVSLPQHTDIPAKAIIYTVIFSAATHLSLALYSAVSTGDVNQANIFHILGIDLVWPEIGKGDTNAALSVIFGVSIWLIMVAIVKHANKSK